jgi:hypothetical protein
VAVVNEQATNPKGNKMNESDLENMSDLDKMKTDGLTDYEKLLWLRRSARMAAAK